MKCIIIASCAGCASNLNLTRLGSTSSGALSFVRVGHSLETFLSFKISANNFQVRSERGRSAVFLTGIGYLSHDCLRVSDDSDVSYADSPQDL